MKGYYKYDGEKPIVGWNGKLDTILVDGTEHCGVDHSEVDWSLVDYWRDAGQPVGEDVVNHPPHYTDHPSGVECIQITEYMSFCRGNAVKYLFRAGKKGDEIEDLKKARWYIDREIQRLEKLK